MFLTYCLYKFSDKFIVTVGSCGGVLFFGCSDFFFVHYWLTLYAFQILFLDWGQL
jgi:hypothetical protein